MNHLALYYLIAIITTPYCCIISSVLKSEMLPFDEERVALRTFGGSNLAIDGHSTSASVLFAPSCAMIILYKWRVTIIFCRGHDLLILQLYCTYHSY